MFGRLVLIYLIVTNLIGFAAFGIDKRKAIKDQWRIPEKTLILIALIGGSVGAFLGMQVFHHKTRHWKFLIGVPACILLHVFIAGFCWWKFLI